MIITIANHKGGVGKTATAANLSAALSLKGKKVLAVDLDPQAALSIALKLDGSAEDVTDNTYGLLLGRKTSPVRYTKNFDVIPSTLDLAAAEMGLARQIAFERILRERLAVFAGSYDYIIIDSPPSLGVLAANALVAADILVVPVQCEYPALKALDMFTDIVERAKLVNPKLKMRLLMTMFTKQTAEAERAVAEARKNFETFTPVITRTSMFSRSVRKGVPLVMLDGKAEQSRAYKDFAREIMKL